MCSASLIDPGFQTREEDGCDIPEMMTRTLGIEAPLTKWPGRTMPTYDIGDMETLQTEFAGKDGCF